VGGAGGAAPALVSADVVTPARISYSHASTAANAKDQPRKRRSRGEPVLRARGPAGEFVVTGQTARALAALVRAGRHGITALEVSSWAYRLGAYVHRLRHENELAIETVRENA